MSTTTSIEWTDASWNPVTGCSEVSEGCEHCYAKTFAERWRDTSGHYFASGFDVRLRRDKLAAPLRWRTPRRVFVNSMSDLFHTDVPDEYIAEVFAVMAACPQHTFQLLTKRPGRMRSLLLNDAFADRAMDRSLVITPVAAGERPHGDTWPLPNLWVGVSVENQRWADVRLPVLAGTPAAIRWVSAEPLLGPVNLSPWLGDGFDADGTPAGWRSTLDWVVAGGESGYGARPMHPGWARSLRDQCAASRVPFLFKQRGAWTWDARYGNPDGTGSDPWADRDPDAYVTRLDGRTADVRTAMAEGGDWHGVYRVGKGRAGRDLDGTIHDDFPAPDPR
ncbi:phage Gp37/Gp68 family protein [Amycolatopsis ultiminotia]|uniref:Phage Gp37/Gp68 family protein n=1 Tax=Amycolatopsis ultiminotia TaxID=543629 RepID=A0ABP6WPJ8_9PSEU